MRFSVTVGSIFEDSHIPLRKWFIAIYLLTSHKKGISSMQLSKDIGVTQKTAWFMLHRIRFMCSRSSIFKLWNIVEVDETYMGGKPRRTLDENGKRIMRKRGRGTKKTPVVGLSQRGGEMVAKPVKHTDRATLHDLIRIHVNPGSVIMTDEYRPYQKLSKDFEHKTINHSEGQFALNGVHVNTLEGFWGLLKRGLIGTYHYMSAKHLDLYCDEFTFRYNTRKKRDCERFSETLRKSHGKRLMYKDLVAKTF
jgi:transposase-like protein